jgi:hypothetical protein
MISPAVAAIIAAVIFIAGFAGGWSIKDWKDGAEIARLQSDNAVKSAANQRCETDIESVRTGIKQITEAVGKREEAARNAMSQAEVLAAKHSKTAVTIKAAPVIPAANQCEAIVKEQIEYVTARRIAE